MNGSINPLPHRSTVCATRSVASDRRVRISYGYLPKLLCRLDRCNQTFAHHLVAVAVQVPMMISTQWHADRRRPCVRVFRVVQIFEMMCTTGRYFGLITVQALLLTIGSSESRASTSEDQKRLCAPDFPPLRFRNPERRSDYGLRCEGGKPVSAQVAQAYSAINRSNPLRRSNGTRINLRHRHQC